MDLSKLEFTVDWFKEKNDLQFTFDLIATIILFLLILIFYRLNEKKTGEPNKIAQISSEITRFIRMKNIIAMFLIPIFLLLAIYSLSRWIFENFFSIVPNS